MQGSKSSHWETKEYMEKRSGEGNGNNRLEIQLEEDGD